MASAYKVAATLESGRVLTFTGRDAWCLNQLVRAGDKGITPIDNPAPRIGAYVFNLRRAGLEIETIHESHKGPFPGTHGRYVLRQPISLETLE